MVLNKVIFDMGSVFIGWEFWLVYGEYFVSEFEFEDFLCGFFCMIYDVVYDGDGLIVECVVLICCEKLEWNYFIDVYE